MTASITSEVQIWAAGGGKTTRIIERAVAAKTERCALITYTLNNVSEIGHKIYERSRQSLLMSRSGPGILFSFANSRDLINALWLMVVLRAYIGRKGRQRNMRPQVIPADSISKEISSTRTRSRNSSVSATKRRTEPLCVGLSSDSTTSILMKCKTWSDTTLIFLN